MHVRPLLRTLAGALCVGLVARGASAQSMARTVARTVAVYDIGGTPRHDHSWPSRVTVADSAGKLVASYRTASDTVAHPMGVIMYGDDLVLVGETSRGVLEMQFYDQLDRPRHGLIAGHWSRGEQEGQLQGRVKN